MKLLWQTKIDRIFETKPKDDHDIFLEIVSMFIHSEKNDDLSTLYNEIGLEHFINLLGLLGGKNFALPTQNDLKDTILASLCFYYRELKQKSWEEIHTLLPFNDLNTISYGIRIANLKQEIVDQVSNNFEELERRGVIEEIKDYV